MPQLRSLDSARLVQRDDGAALAYHPGELAKVEAMKTVVGGPMP